MQRLLERKVIFITGADEHGEKMAAFVAATGRTQRSIVIRLKSHISCFGMMHVYNTNYVHFTMFTVCIKFVLQFYFLPAYGHRI
uniref:OVA1 n=1 Tax=Arundo donax TaxID=35708 RepID=A0A0A9AT42_ARUDO